MLDSNEIADIEIRVIRDVIDAVELRLRRSEASGRQLTASRSLIYATVIYAVVASARAQSFRPTLDGAEVLDSILEGTEAAKSGDFLEETIRIHTAISGSADE